MKKMKQLFLTASLVACFGPVVAATNLVTNGGFEADVLGSGGISTFSQTSQGLTGWTVGLNTVDVVNSSFWDAASGVNSLDLNGLKKGEIHQALSTTTGQLYQLSFDLAGNFYEGSAVKLMSVNLGPVGTYSFDTTGKSANDMGWTHFTTTFVAISASTNLSFMSNIPGRAGAALDNVSVLAVPEPESYAMLLAGLGLIGGIACRRAKKA